MTNDARKEWLADTSGPIQTPDQFLRSYVNVHRDAVGAALFVPREALVENLDHRDRQIRRAALEEAEKVMLLRDARHSFLASCACCKGGANAIRALMAKERA